MAWLSWGSRLSGQVRTEGWLAASIFHSTTLHVIVSWIAGRGCFNVHLSLEVKLKHTRTFFVHNVKIHAHWEARTQSVQLGICCIDAHGTEQAARKAKATVCENRVIFCSIPTVWLIWSQGSTWLANTVPQSYWFRQKGMRWVWHSLAICITYGYFHRRGPCWVLRDYALNRILRDLFPLSNGMHCNNTEPQSWGCGGGTGRSKDSKAGIPGWDLGTQHLSIHMKHPYRIAQYLIYSSEN